MANKVSQAELQALAEIANRIRIHCVTSTSAANSGHPSTCSSIAEILSVLFFNTMHYKVEAPKDLSSDRFVLSKGHAAPALYAVWAEAGLFPVSELNNLRKLGSDLEGHPTPRLNFIDVGTGSLGQGLAIAGGMAYVGKYYDKAQYRVYCLIGDGESAEGSIWESIQFASYYKLDNLCLIIDANRLGQSEATIVGHDLELYRKRLEAFGFYVRIVDGHDVAQLIDAFEDCKTIKGQPTAVVAKTFKGRNFPGIEDNDGWHGKPLGEHTERVLKHLRSLVSHPGPCQLKTPPPYKEVVPPIDISNIKLSSPPSYNIGDSLATRVAYGNALVKLAQSHPRVIALDGDMKNSTYAELLKKYDDSRFIECFIAEQSLVGTATGATCRNRAVAFISTFAAFLTRAYDQIRMAAISQSNINFCGSHCGVSIGEDGASQMALEDISMFRSIPGSTIFYPADAVATERAVELAANTKGITFIRTSRPATTIIYPNDYVFKVGKSNVIRESQKDKLVLIGGGVTLQEAILAYNELSKNGINVRILDLFTIKPLDKEGLIRNARECGHKILVVEDHYYEGGIGEAVASAIASEGNIILKHVAVPRVPRSGTPAAVLDYYGLNAKHIVKYVQEFLQ